MTDKILPPSTDAPAEGPDPTEKPFVAHLLELRNRLLRTLACVAILLLALMPFSNDIYHWLAAP
ncbi:MAG: twin-arginine translocase subunit TatC, partial [Gammaproteobacteria bacterium]